MANTPRAATRAAPSDVTTYYNEEGFLLLAPQYRVECPDNPFRRLAYSLYLGWRDGFSAELGEGRAVAARAVLLAPGVARKRILAESGGMIITDFPVHTAEAARLRRFMAGREIIALDSAALESLARAFARDLHETPRGEDIAAWRSAVLNSLCSDVPDARIDPRVLAVMEAVRAQPRDEIRLDAMARVARVSASRLRHLFVDEVGITLRQYARTQLVWRGVARWAPGIALTELAHDVGACDLAYFDRAFYETFGRSPSSLINSIGSRVIRC